MSNIHSKELITSLPLYQLHLGCRLQVHNIKLSWTPRVDRRRLLY